MRLFLALEIPDKIKDKIATLQGFDLSGARWTSREQWHITLHFIGDCDDDATIRKGMQAVDVSTFDVQLEGVGQFPERGKPRILWSGIVASQTLQDLHAATGQALHQSIDYKVDERSYMPHLTLARFKRDVPKREVMQAYFDKYKSFITDTFTITDFVLYESQLLPTGAVYTVRERFSLSQSI